MVMDSNSDAPNGPQLPEKSRRLERLRPSGGYRRLRSFRVATIIYDATVAFCEKFVDKKSRTHDQMVQAARSGRQNIAEGSRASATSSQTELRLVNVARASLDELLLDYEDFLRQHSFIIWEKNSPDAVEVRRVGQTRSSEENAADEPEVTDKKHSLLYKKWLKNKSPEIVANTLICLIHQTNYLLDKQIKALETQFVKEGGYSERLAMARYAERNRSRN